MDDFTILLYMLYDFIVKQETEQNGALAEM